MRSLFFILFVLATSSSALAARSDDKESPAAFTCVFWSCNKHTANQSFWRTIADTATSNTKDKKIDAASCLGDCAYLDKIAPFWPLRQQAVPEDIRRGFKLLSEDPFYSEFLQKHVKRLAGFVRDDHELKNDGNKLDLYREELQQYFLDLQHVPRGVGDGDSAAAFTPSDKFSKHYSAQEIHLRRNKRFGLYSFDKVPIEDSKKSVCFVNLDMRTHRDPPRADGGGDELGEEQWRWLEEVLKTGQEPDLTASPSTNNNKKSSSSLDSECAVTFIGSGVQILSDEKPTEGWQQHPGARDRLMKLIGRSGARRIVLLSGDVHLAEVMRATGSESPFRNPQQDLFEVTSSGLTHSASAVSPSFSANILTDDIYKLIFPQPRRVGAAFLQKNFGVIRLFRDNEKDDDDFRVVITVHAIEDGREVLRVEPAFSEKKGAAADDSVLDDYHLPLLHAPLTQMILTIHATVAPSLPRYLTIFATMVAAVLGGGFVMFAILKMLRRAFLSKRKVD